MSASLAFPEKSPKSGHQPFRSHLPHGRGRDDGVVADVVNFECADAVAHQHIGLSAARAEIAEAGDLPFQADLAYGDAIRDVVVADVVDLERAGRGVAQHHITGIGAEETAETYNLET